MGINTTRFLVLGRKGVYEGYYTEDSEIPKNEATIIRKIIQTEECMEWGSMTKGELEQYRDFLKAQPGRA